MFAFRVVCDLNFKLAGEEPFFKFQISIDLARWKFPIWTLYPGYYGNDKASERIKIGWNSSDLP